MAQPGTAAHVRLDRHPQHTSAVTATLTGSSPTTARALLSVHGFRATGERTLVLARIDHEEPHYAQQAAHALRAAGLTVEITTILQEDIDTEWDWTGHPLHWLDRDEIREVSDQAQQIHDDIVSGRLIIHLHAHDGWTTVAVGTYRDGHSVHLHGEDHLRQIALDFTSAAEAISDFERLHGAAVRPGPAPATDTEHAAAQALTPVREAQSETEAHEAAPRTVPVYAADAGDNEALLADFLDNHHDWEKYRTWSDETTIASHESLTRRAGSPTRPPPGTRPGPSPSTTLPSASASGTPPPVPVRLRPSSVSCSTPSPPLTHTAWGTRARGLDTSASRVPNRTWPRRPPPC